MSSLNGEPKQRETMRLPRRVDWDNGEMIPHSSGEYCEHENVCECLGERDQYIHMLETEIARMKSDKIDMLRRMLKYAPKDENRMLWCERIAKEQLVATMKDD